MNYLHTAIAQNVLKVAALSQDARSVAPVDPVGCDRQAHPKRPTRIGSSIAVSGKVEGDELLAVAGALEASARERSSRRPFES